jgi:hypothetical protein
MQQSYTVLDKTEMIGYLLGNRNFPGLQDSQLSTWRERYNQSVPEYDLLTADRDIIPLLNNDKFLGMISENMPPVQPDDMSEPPSSSRYLLHEQLERGVNTDWTDKTSNAVLRLLLASDRGKLDITKQSIVNVSGRNNTQYSKTILGLKGTVSNGNKSFTFGRPEDYEVSIEEKGALRGHSEFADLDAASIDILKSMIDIKPEDDIQIKAKKLTKAFVTCIQVKSQRDGDNLLAHFSEEAGIEEQILSFISKFQAGDEIEALLPLVIDELSPVTAYEPTEVISRGTAGAFLQWLALADFPFLETVKGRQKMLDAMNDYAGNRTKSGVIIDTDLAVQFKIMLNGFKGEHSDLARVADKMAVMTHFRQAPPESGGLEERTQTDQVEEDYAGSWRLAYDATRDYRVQVIGEDEKKFPSLNALDRLGENQVLAKMDAVFSIKELNFRDKCKLVKDILHASETDSTRKRSDRWDDKQSNKLLEVLRQADGTTKNLKALKKEVERIPGLTMPSKSGTKMPQFGQNKLTPRGTSGAFFQWLAFADFPLLCTEAGQDKMITAMNRYRGFIDADGNVENGMAGKVNENKIFVRDFYINHPELYRYSLMMGMKARQNTNKQQVTPEDALPQVPPGARYNTQTPSWLAIAWNWVKETFNSVIAWLRSSVPGQDVQATTFISVTDPQYIFRMSQDTQTMNAINVLRIQNYMNNTVEENVSKLSQDWGEWTDNANTSLKHLLMPDCIFEPKLIEKGRAEDIFGFMVWYTHMLKKGNLNDYARKTIRGRYAILFTQLKLLAGQGVENAREIIQKLIRTDPAQTADDWLALDQTKTQLDKNDHKAITKLLYRMHRSKAVFDERPEIDLSKNSGDLEITEGPSFVDKALNVLKMPRTLQMLQGEGVCAGASFMLLDRFMKAESDESIEQTVNKLFVVRKPDDLRDMKLLAHQQDINTRNFDRIEKRQPALDSGPEVSFSEFFSKIHQQFDDAERIACPIGIKGHMFLFGRANDKWFLYDYNMRKWPITTARTSDALADLRSLENSIQGKIFFDLQSSILTSQGEDRLDSIGALQVRSPGIYVKESGNPSGADFEARSEQQQLFRWWKKSTVHYNERADSWFGGLCIRASQQHMAQIKEAAAPAGNAQTGRAANAQTRRAALPSGGLDLDAVHSADPGKKGDRPPTQIRARSRSTSSGAVSPNRSARQGGDSK